MNQVPGGRGRSFDRTRTARLRSIVRGPGDLPRAAPAARMLGTVPSAPTPDFADRATIERARSGDVDALADLWVVYQPQLLRLLRRRGCSAAEDVASQTWLDVRRGLARFEGDGQAFRSWISTIALRRSIDEHHRDARRSAAVASQQTLVTPPLVEPLGRSFDGVMTLLNALQPAAAEVVELRILHDLPVAEVAELTGQTEANVRVLAHRALARLRELLDERSDLRAALGVDLAFT